MDVVLTLATYKTQWKVSQLKTQKTENTKTVSFLRLVISKAVRLVELWLSFNENIDEAIIWLIYWLIYLLKQVYEELYIL